MTTTTSVTPQQALTRNLTALAELLQATPDLPHLPYVTTSTLDGSVSAQWYVDLHASGWIAQKADAAAIVRALGGHWDKREGHDGKFEYRQNRDGIRLLVQVERAAVCERVVTGTTTVTRTVPDPDALAAVPTVEVTEDVEQVEWRCQPLLDTGAVAS